MSFDRGPVSLPSFQGVAVSQTGVLNLPPIGTYYGILVRVTTSMGGGPTQANLEAQIAQMRLKLNGVEQRRYSARSLFDLNANKNIGLTAGATEAYIFIHFADMHRESQLGEDLPAWGMGGVQSFTLEIDLGAGITAPTLEAWAMWSKITRGVGPIIKVREESLSPGGAGVILHKPALSDAFVGMHYDMTAVTVSAAEIKVNREQKIAADYKTQIDEFYTRMGGFAPQSDYFHIAFDGFTGRASEFLAILNERGQRLVTDYEARLTVGGAGVLPVQMELFGLPDGF